MWPAVKRFLTPDQFRLHVESLDFSRWRPIGVVWHNTASPTLKRWHEVPRAKWMVNLESYYKSLGWNGGPHLFIDDGPDGLGLFNPLNARGTHSPSFNAQWLGFEHVGDYSKEDDDTGPGLKVKQNGIAATAIVCAHLGIDPMTHIKLHKEDPRTTHDCPGKDMARDKAEMIQSVIEYIDIMSDSGDHEPDWGHVVEPDRPILFSVKGKMSTFGGPEDTGVTETEGLALFSSEAEMSAHGIGDFILPGTTGGLAHRLDPTKPYIACRWNYDRTNKRFLQDATVHVEANGKKLLMRAVDWGPNAQTGRVTDLSPGGATYLDLDTDDVCTVTIYEDGK